MKKLFVLMTVIASLFACSGEDIVLDNLTSTELSRSMDDGFDIARLFVKSDGGYIGGNSNKRFLTADQITRLCIMGNAAFMSKSPVIREMSRRLEAKLKDERLIGLAYDFTPYLPTSPVYDKEAYYDPVEKRIYFRQTGATMSERVILHELLHAFQIELANVTPTVTNETGMEFELAVVQDILQIMMWNGEYSGYLEGGDRDSPYYTFVHDVAIGVGGCNEDCMISHFEALYKSKYGEDCNYHPSFLIYVWRLMHQIW